jgi:hypothetical protein|tara:strand:- start:3451 stop:3654 length:204 start_codon:yes stop_codon:yes gene_type:complete
MKKYIGVTKRRKSGRVCFVSRVYHEGVVYSCGVFPTDEEAARAYDKAVMRLGLDKRMNFFKKKLAQE